MTLPPAAFRLPPVACLLAACLLAVALALLAGGCGEESTGAVEGSTARQSAPTTSFAPNPGAARVAGCPKQLGAFVDSLETLRRQLAVGLSYDDYIARVKSLHAAYENIPIDRLTFDCLATGTPTEKVLNKHIDAANAWGECLADATCTTATIEPVLQRKWRVASKLLSEAR